MNFNQKTMNNRILFNFYNFMHKKLTCLLNANNFKQINYVN